MAFRERHEGLKQAQRHRHPTRPQMIMSHYYRGFQWHGWRWGLSLSPGTTPCSYGQICLMNDLTNVGVNANLVADRWTHVVMTRSGTTYTFYVNGSVMGTAQTGPATLNPPDASDKITIGIDTQDGSPFYGMIDELHVFNRSLSASEVSQLYSWEYNSTRRGNKGFINNFTNVSLAFRAKNYSFNDTGLVGWWDLGDSTSNESVTLSSLDLSGLNNTMSITTTAANPASLISTCVIGKCWDFTSVYGYVPASAPYISAYNFSKSGAFTLSAWAKRLGYATGAILIFQGETLILGYNSVTGMYGIQMRDVNGARNSINTDEPSGWQNIVAAWNGTNLTLYINGSFKGWLNVTNLTGSVGLPQIATDLWGGHTYPGAVDDVKFWNRSLSASEITALYNAGNPTNSTGQEGNWTAFTSEYYGGNASLSGTGTVGNMVQYRASFNATSSNYSAFLQNVTFNASLISVPDLPPTWSANGTNDSEAGALVQFRTLWAEDVALGYYIFSFDNGTGSFTNDTIVKFAGVSNWTNVTKLINNTARSAIRWRVWANDSAGNANQTDVEQFTSTGVVVSANSANNLANNFSNGAFNQTTTTQSQSVYVQWNDGSKFGRMGDRGGQYYSASFILNHTSPSTVNYANWSWYESAGLTRDQTGSNLGNDTVVLDLHFENDTKDATRNNNTGAIANASALTFNSKCFTGGCYSFDGANGIVNFAPAPFNFSNATNFTVAFWINTTGQGRYILGSYSSAGKGWGIYHYPTGGPSAGLNAFAYGAVGSNDHSFGVTTNVNDNTWHHVVATYTFSSALGGNNALNITIFVNGTQKTSFSGNTGDISSGSPNLIIGTIRSGLTPYFNGSIDELHVWNRSLSASEVNQLYSWEYNSTGRGNNGYIQNFTNVSLAFRAKNYSFNDSGLVAWWDLGDSSSNETVTNSTLDLSGNGNNLALYGSPVLNTSCVIGNCLNFSATNQLAQSTNSFALPTNYTLAT
ncbi:LamG domain-containing protein, partial [Candidatus Micrarchaeota archaeon]|nr:LamG domain-containing protein [Candidatus Micrarchaeota archaeon]